jgi:hypothetical protein
MRLLPDRPNFQVHTVGSAAQIVSVQDRDQCVCAASSDACIGVLNIKTVAPNHTHWLATKRRKRYG